MSRHVLIVTIVPDYMDRRRTFTVDPDYFPLNRVREIVDYLHEHEQRYSTLIYSRPRCTFPESLPVLMTDPAIAYLPDENYGPYHRGLSDDIWLKSPDGSTPLSLVWPGTCPAPLYTAEYLIFSLLLRCDRLSR